MKKLGAVCLTVLLSAVPTAGGAEAHERVAGAAPRDAIRIDAPGTLREPGYYLLTRDVRAAGHGFVIAARNVTLDLGGHTLTYGTGNGEAFGVASRHQYHSGTITVRGGRIVQGRGRGSACHAVDFEGGHDLRFENLAIDVHGPDACGIHVYGTPTGSVEVRGCTVACRTKVVSDRHYPGVAAIRVADVHVRTVIAGNRVTASPQWGIQVAGKGADTTCTIKDNVVRGTKALVANGYMVGVHRRNVEVMDNLLIGESRGIHVDGVDHEGHGAKIHHNRIVAQDQPNAEFDPHWCHGIKLESTQHTVVHHNLVRVIADATHSEARALDVDARSGGPLHVYANRFEGLSRDAKRKGKALVWSGLETGRPEDVIVEHNVFVATDVLVHRTWHSDTGTVFRSNAWLRDPKAARSRVLLFERWDNRDKKPSYGHGFLDPYAPEGTTASSEWAEPGAYTSTRGHTLRLEIVNGKAAAAGAQVEVRDRDGAGVFRGTTDAAGRIAIPVVVSRVANGGAAAYRGPFTIAVTDAAGKRTRTKKQHVRRAVALRVDLASGAFRADASRPSAPRTVQAKRTAANRAEVTWMAPATGRAVRYIVELDGTPWLLTRETRVQLGGLEQGTDVAVRVRAIGADGTVSKPSTATKLEARDG